MAKECIGYMKKLCCIAFSSLSLIFFLLSFFFFIFLFLFFLFLTYSPIIIIFSFKKIKYIILFFVQIIYIFCLLGKFLKLLICENEWEMRKFWSLLYLFVLNNIKKNMSNSKKKNSSYYYSFAYGLRVKLDSNWLQNFVKVSF